MDATQRSDLLSTSIDETPEGRGAAVSKDVRTAVAGCFGLTAQEFDVLALLEA